MHTPHFDNPAAGRSKVTLPHVSILNGPRPQVATPTPVAAPTVAASPATVVLVGLDDQGRPHASWFGEGQTDAAAVAADLMGFALIDITTDELAAIAANLPKGKLFDSGKAFVPFVKRDTYDRLAMHLDDDYLTNTAARVEAAKQASAEGYAKASKGEVPPRQPVDWSKLLTGDLVLAVEDPTEGWFEALVVEAAGGDKFRLRWRDYPEQPTFTRSIVEIALLHPKSPVR